MLDFPSILPPNRSSFEAALEQVIRKTKPDLSPVATLMDPDLCPGELLGWLAWAFSVDVWDPAWDEAAKRRVLKHSLAMHRRKGTVASVKTALSVLGFHVDLAEWLETGGAPYTFRLDAYSVEVVAAGQELNARLLNITTRLIENVKPVRSHFSLRLGQSFHAPVQTRLGVRGRVLIADQTAPAAPVKSSETAAALRFAARGKAAIRTDAKPAAPARKSQAAAAARLAVTGRAVIRDLITIRVPEGAPYAA